MNFIYLNLIEHAGVPAPTNGGLLEKSVNWSSFLKSHTKILAFHFNLERLFSDYETKII